MEMIGLVAYIIVSVVIGAVIFILGFNDYRQRRDHVAQCSRESNEVLDWIKKQPDEVKRKFLDDYKAIQERKNAKSSSARGSRQ